MDMFNGSKIALMFFILCFLSLIGLGIWSIAEIKKTEAEIDRTIEEYESEIEEAAEQEEIQREGKIIAFMQEFTSLEVEILYVENDSNMYAIKADKDIYRVSYDREMDDIKYILHQDIVVYEKE